MQGFPIIPENNSFQQHGGSYLKKPGECTPCAATFSHFYCPPGGKAGVMATCFPGFDKFIFIKNTSKTAFYGNPRTRVMDISLFCM